MSIEPNAGRVAAVDSIRAYRQEAEASLRSARAAENITALGEMTRGIVHDFRNVLCMVTSGLSIARSNADDPVKLALALSALDEGVARGLKIANRLLAFSAHEDLELGAKNINALVAELKTFLSYGAGPGIRVLLELSPDLPKCRIDPPQVSAAIFNLIVNARDAMPEGGTIRISTRMARLDRGGDAHHYVRLRIRDDGAGMPANVLGKIFDPFFTTKGERGTGLGVPQVQALMRAVGGEVRVHSIVGKGTTFDLFFPVDTTPQTLGADNCSQLDRWADEGGATVAAPMPHAAP